MYKNISFEKRDIFFDDLGTTFVDGSAGIERLAKFLGAKCQSRDERSGLVYYGRRFYSPELGRWLTPDPAGFVDGMNLYAFVENDPLTQFDEYGLYLSAPSVEGLLNRTRPKYAEGVAWGTYSLAKDFVRHTSSALTYMGRSEWESVRPFDEALYSEQVSRPITRAMTQFLSKACIPKWDDSHFQSGYQSGRWNTLLAAETLLFMPAAAERMEAKLVKYASSLPRIFKETPKLNRFHQAARNLSEVGQNNIRILRGWAESKGWIREMNIQDAPERWGILRNGKFEWNLRIKPEGSTRSGLQPSSMQPRFDARLGNHPPYDYINPFTGVIGDKTVGTHILLE